MPLDVHTSSCVSRAHYSVLYSPTYSPVCAVTAVLCAALSGLHFILPSINFNSGRQSSNSLSIIEDILTTLQTRPPALDDDLDDIRDADEAAQRAAVTNTTSYACAPPPMTATDVTRALREMTAAFVLGLSSSMVEEHTGGHARGRLVHVIRALDTTLA